MEPDLGKDEFVRIFQLTTRQPWLHDKAQEVFWLLNECGSQDQKTLLIDLLWRFEYLDQHSFSSGITSIAEYLLRDCALPPEQVQLYGLQINRDSDSSGEMLYRLDIELNTKFEGGVKARNAMNKAPEDPLCVRPYVVLVDEFVGSGQTASGRIKYLFEQAERKGQKLDPKNVFLCFFAGMADAIKGLRDREEVNIFCVHELKKGIKDAYEGDELTTAYQHMDNLEETLADPDYFNGDPLPKRGYNEAETLYFREGGNPPNNIFPIFWWPSSKKSESGARRTTVLRRRI